MLRKASLNLFPYDRIAVEYPNRIMGVTNL